jgi:hypothetical protein
MGEDSSMRRPTRPTMRSTQVLLGGEAERARGDPAVALDVDRVVAVDHDLGDARVFEHPLQRPEPERVVLDVLDEPGAFVDGQQQLLVLDDRGQLLTYELVELRLGERRIVDPTAQALEQLLDGTRLDHGQGIRDDQDRNGVLSHLVVRQCLRITRLQICVRL